MKYFISIALILISLYSLGQPGDLDLTMKVQDSIEFMVVDGLGDTITSENIDSKNFSIRSYNIWGNEYLWGYEYLHCADKIQTPLFRTSSVDSIGFIQKPPIRTCSIDSIGIISNQHSTTFYLSYEPDKSRFWARNAWVIHIRHMDQKMLIYIDRPNPKIGNYESHSMYLFHFNPGNYYFLDEPTMYFNDGLLITDSLISVDKTQPEKLEKLFEIYEVRKKLCR